MKRPELIEAQRLALMNAAIEIHDKAVKIRAWMKHEMIDPRDPIWLGTLRIISGAEMVRDHAIKQK